jgi:hypothetical protein
MIEEEVYLIRNGFGAVSNKRISLAMRSGFEDIAIENVTAIRFEHHKNKLVSILSFVLFFLGLKVLILPNSKVGVLESVLFLIGAILFLLLGIANYIGHHTVKINVSGNNRKPIKVEMSRSKEGKEFVMVIIKIILR